jgi:hypothetical protein
MNGDGSLDLVAANGNPAASTYPGMITVLTNNGSGIFSSNSVCAAGNRTVYLVTADVNGDGSMDVVCANQNDNTMTVLTNAGNAQLVFASTIPVGTGPSCLVAANVAGSGRPDLICANSWINTLTVLLNSPAAPALKLQATDTNTLVVNWSAAWPGFGLQQNPDTGTAGWLNDTDVVTTVAGVSRVVLSPSTDNNFYRLSHP